jgi:hypothetical protein
MDLSQEKIVYYCLFGIHFKNSSAALCLATYYRNIKNYDQANKYYRIGIELGSIECMYQLAKYYEFIKRDEFQMTTYYLYYIYEKKERLKSFSLHIDDNNINDLINLINIVNLQTIEYICVRIRSINKKNAKKIIDALTDKLTGKWLVNKSIIRLSTVYKKATEKIEK